ncbi:hypothetical protein [Chryseobacterium geocarposphaerae]|uniref:Uncharacterized protein n=1 Tax=Chryseobacterium geocarposphaerae TaxID=1416776 RepID=A0A2M9C5R3_9FLAO|nr:hypothetical protein [Chryseobacterium geocarposphaerae]PJJ66188.1 hypothetical protein CLV73_0154 [Chryseobacterium geocarposphaerae]
MAKWLTFLLVIINSFSKAQDYVSNPYEFNCEDFDMTIVGNLRMNVQLVNNILFNHIKKDSIIIPKINSPDQNTLWKEFNLQFKGQITEHCINSKVLQDDKVISVPFCDERTKITIVAKIENYFIFNVKTFEIDNYILFNTKNKIAYFSSSFPTILDNGKIIIDKKMHTMYHHGVKIYEMENDIPKTFSVSFPRQYNLQKSYIAKDWNNKVKVLFDLIRYDLKEIPSSESSLNTKYVYDKDKYCRKLIVISK